ncbi:MAG: ABC transporter ATP-binding protein [Actinomycetaceae bacterium]|nr:ABC transporter ATP-binding protein [Actinomycetaceae bacterium]
MAANPQPSHNAASDAAADASPPAGDLSRAGESALVRVEHLTKDYRSNRALTDLSLTLPAGSIVALVGNNGAGKTTLLKILAGLVADYTGRVTIADHPVGPESKALVSFLPDRNFLDTSLTATKAIDLYSRFFTDFDATKAREMVRFFKLPDDRPLKAMSKGTGEKLRVALVMSRKARVYLLDEPISGVDPAARDVILNGVLSDFDPGALMIISTHLIAEVETTVDSVIFLRDGRVLLSGNADDLREQHASSLDALFRKEYR